MSKKNGNKINARRNLLKSLAAGSGAVIAGKSLPESWSRPVVEAVILPAHAQLSVLSAFTGSGVLTTSIETDSRFARVVDGLINDAHALDNVSATNICIKIDGEGTVSVDAIIGDAYSSTMVSASNVPVGPQSSTVMTANDCNNPQQFTFSLIKDAQAGTFFSQIGVIVTSIDGRAIGRFIVQSEGTLTITFDIPPGDCTAPACPPPPVRPRL